MLMIRLRRVGGTNAPAYRIVVSDSRRTPTAKVIEELGSYDPTKTPTLLDFDAEKANAWIAKGARASETVRRLIVKTVKTVKAPAPQVPA